MTIELVERAGSAGPKMAGRSVVEARRNVTPGLLRETWYMAAWSTEIGETPLSRRIAGERLVLWRTAEGQAVALFDRCPHRFAALSQGRRDGDTLVCSYHGLTFDARGACVRNPFASQIPPGAAVKSFKIVERDGIAWIWFGQSDTPDESRIPDFRMLAETAGQRTLTGLVPMNANYEFGSDNLLDLSHIEFVHTGTFAGAGVIFAGQHKVIQEGTTIHSNWWMPGVKAPAHTAGIYPPEMVTDHWLDMRWDAPASMYLQIGATPVGGDRAAGVIVHQAHILTPETVDRTHYFWASTYATPPGQPDMGAMIEAMLDKVFNEEDKPIIEASYANLDGQDFWSQQPVSLGIDQAGTRARRQTEALLRKENG